MDQRRSVRCRDHRHFHIEQVHQQMFAVFIDMVPHLGREAAESAHIYLSAERVARAGHYDNSVLLIACDISESVAELLVRRPTPFECRALGMKAYLQNPSLP